MLDINLKVLVFAEVDSDNLGDQAIYSGMTTFLAGRGGDVHAISIEKCRYYKDYSAAAKGVSSSAGLGEEVNKKAPRISKLRHFLRRIYLPVWACLYVARLLFVLLKLDRPNLAVIGGGGIIMNNNYHFPFAIAAFSFFARRMKIPYGFAGVSTGGSLNAVSRKLFAYALSGASFVFARDRNTNDFLREKLAPDSRRVDLGPDFAFYNKCESPRIRNDRPIKVLVNVTSNSIPVSDSSFLSYQNDLKNLLVQLSADSRFEVALFTTGWPSDEAEKELIKNELLLNSGILVSAVPHPKGLQDLLDVLKSADLVLASRLHAAILGVLLGAQVEVLPYNKKTENFIKSIGLGCDDYSWPTVSSIYRAYVDREDVWNVQQEKIVLEQRRLGDVTLGNEVDRVLKSSR